ncbi:dickkopf-related protein 4-like [Sinocyclocheilus grahami]|uniref:dickkopf-related protein 4-like n=1 Tax=Sinocyclocheilus grahami TaxID=75366 RepID=UPI0007AD4122|nr:PREDICTED: dickkopf-related protein 4-like [Sinocyclocheilus grahami]
MQTVYVIFCLSVVSAVQCLDSNIIRSSREMTNSQESVLHLQSDTVANSHNSVRRTSAVQGIRDASPPAQDCSTAQATECKGSKKKQRNAAKTKIQLDVRGSQKVPEMFPCVRSRDCDEGMCCALYLTGKRCQRVPVMGEVCLLRGRAKLRRRLERCDCEKSLQCRTQPDSLRGQGVCQPEPRS